MVSHVPDCRTARIYLRISANEQVQAGQKSLVESVHAAGFHFAHVYFERQMGTKKSRPELQRLIQDLEQGDMVVVEKIEHITQILPRDARRFVAAVHSNEASIAIPGILDLPKFSVGFDRLAQITSKPTQEFLIKAILQLGRDYFSERREPQVKGIAFAKAAGKFSGRKTDQGAHDQIIALRKAGNTIAQTANLAGCSESQVKRVWAMRIDRHARKQEFLSSSLPVSVTGIGDGMDCGVGTHAEKNGIRDQTLAMELFSALGFSWNRSAVPLVLPIHPIERVTFRFYRMLPEFVWDACMLEGNPFTFPEVKTLLDGVTVGGRKIFDQEQVLNLAQSSRHLLALVKAGKFSVDKVNFTALNGLVVRNEALEWGHFRGEGKETSFTPDVGLGEHGRYTPSPTVAGAAELNRVFADGLQALQTHVRNPFEKAAAFFIFGTLQKFFFCGNKRTAQFMMNCILMSAGIDAISVPAARAQEFKIKMVRFYLSKDATEMMAFLADCHPDAVHIHEANQNASIENCDAGTVPELSRW